MQIIFVEVNNGILETEKGCFMSQMRSLHIYKGLS